jgi:hypothetical protein
MKFIALFSLKDNVDQVKLAEVIARRIDYVHPVKMIAEYHGAHWTRVGVIDHTVTGIGEQEKCTTASQISRDYLA